MIKTLVPFDHVQQLSKTDVAYAQGEESLSPFYQYPHSRISFQKIIRDKSTIGAPRAVLCAVLRDQYAHLSNTEAVMENIAALEGDMAFTVTTAHQPCLFLGPVYTLYKSFTTVNLAEAVSGLVNPEHKIVPVFVIGGEDHDMEEMNHVKLFNKTITWETEQKGPVGMMSTEDLKPVLAQLKEVLGEGEYSKVMYEHIERAYSEQPTIARATQAILHDIFGQYGFLVLDMNDRRLKEHFIPIMRDELLHQNAHKLVTETIAELNAAGFKTQAMPREINLFYMKKGFRERIVLENDRYKVLNSDLEFSQTEILAELEAHPEHFSPNVVLRPLFQETILPNLAYVGGGGEIAYWLERKRLFDHYKLNFPLLVRRASVVWLDRETVSKLKKLDITYQQFFEDPDALVRQYVQNHTEATLSLEPEKEKLAAIFDSLKEKSTRIDPTLEKAVLAEHTRQLAALDQLESRFHRAEKQKHEATITQLLKTKERIFPGNGLQERLDNFMQFYIRYGGFYLKTLKEHLKPMEKGVVVLVDNREL